MKKQNMKKQNKCVFCGKPAEYYSFTAECDICLKCLNQLLKGQEPEIVIKND